MLLVNQQLLLEILVRVNYQALNVPSLVYYYGKQGAHGPETTTTILKSGDVMPQGFSAQLD